MEEENPETGKKLEETSKTSDNKSKTNYFKTTSDFLFKVLKFAVFYNIKRKIMRTKLNSNEFRYFRTAEGNL